MKTLKTTLALLVAALLPLALFAAPSSAVIGVDDQPVGGSMYFTPPSDKTIKLESPLEEDRTIQLYANFPDGVRSVSFYKTVEGTTTKITTLTSNSSGNAYYPSYKVQAGLQTIFAEDANDNETNTRELTGTPTPQSTTAVLNAPTNGGKTWTAQFGEPAVPGKATELQIQRIYTDEVSDVDAVDLGVGGKTKRVGEWKTIATSTQNASGGSTFNLSSPYPYRVEHRYRAVSGTAKSCEQTDASLPTTCQKFGLPQTTPEDTGLSAVYFNTNEGQAVDTRTRYFEGEFEMTAGAAGCTAVPKMKFSTMKGRGNYSWSFKRKSYTLKLGSSTNLCGMGASKKYALVSQDYDKSFLRNPLAQYIGKKFNKMAWTPESRPVDFYLNGKYLGNYMLVERIAIAADRINVPEMKGAVDNGEPNITGGYVLEWDFRKGADYNAYLGSDSGYVGVKEPENDVDREGQPTGKGITSEQKSYINTYLNKVDGVLRGSNFRDNVNGWKKYIDKDSAVDYYIAMEYMKPVDGNMWASVYMYKQRDTAAGAEDGKLFLGPMWDFDLGAGSATRAGNVASPSSFYLRNFIQHSAQQDTTNGKTWFNRLNEDPEFRTAVAARWDQVTSDPGFNPAGFLDEQKSIIQDSANTSFSKAPNGASHSYRISSYQVIKGTSWISDFNYLRSWANSRESWLSGSSGF